MTPSLAALSPGIPGTGAHSALSGDRFVDVHRPMLSSLPRRCGTQPPCYSVFMYGSQVSASQTILRSLADDHRRVVSLWRALVNLRRASHNLSPDERRWRRIPATEGEVSPILIQMQRRGTLRRLIGTRGVYAVTIPYAQELGSDEREALFEINPYAILSHFSALVFHGLTQEQPKVITATSAHGWADAPVPVGTTLDEWDHIAMPSAPRPAQVVGMPVRWRPGALAAMLGVEAHAPLGVPYRITSVERTLVESLQDPNASGGVGNVLRAWSEARDRVDVDAVVQLTERSGITLLRQRVGFVLEELGLSHPRLDAWASQSVRGGSSRLVGSEPSSSRSNARWNLSLNGPVDVLREESWV